MIDVKKIWLTDAAVWIETADGRQACEQLRINSILDNCNSNPKYSECLHNECGLSDYIGCYGSPSPN